MDIVVSCVSNLLFVLGGGSCNCRVTYDVKHPFILICHRISSLEVQVFCPFFKTTVFIFLLSFKNSLYILGNSILSDVSLANNFSQYVAYPFILLTLSFTAQKFLILMNPSLSICSFMDCALIFY